MPWEEHWYDSLLNLRAEWVPYKEKQFSGSSVLICIIDSTVLLNLYNLKSRYKFLVVQLLSRVRLFVTP